METSFTAEIMNVDFPNSVRPCLAELFDGKGNPLEHLDAYKCAMVGLRANEAAMCRCFPATLKKDAGRWFDKLPPGSIRNYAQLRESGVVPHSIF